MIDAVPDEVAESRAAASVADAGEADEPVAEAAEPDSNLGSGSSDVASEPVDDNDDEEDAKWGLGPSEPLVGFGAPPVVAVVVTKDAGDWFAETCASLAVQDYESLSVLVIDNGGTIDPSGVVAEHMPSAFVKRLEEDRGFSAAANDVISSVEGAPFLLFLHDDVRLEPSAVTELVAEAFRANAGIVGPKLVDWDRPEQLRSVGLMVDPYGFASEVAEPGELDQSQHDLAREVFAVSGACLLVRADLFTAVGGFSESVPYFGEDTDLCWRAHTAGASVQLCPRATVAHRGQFTQRREVEDPERMLLQHQARSMLTNYAGRRLLVAAPAAFVLSLVDLLGSLVLGRFDRASDIAAAYGGNLLGLPSLLRDRRAVKKSRRVSDSSYLPLMRQGSSRLRTLVRGAEQENRLLAATQAGRSYIRSLDDGPNRLAMGLGAVALVLALLGARNLLTGPLPVLREFVDLGSSGPKLVSQWWVAWRDAGVGESSVPPGFVPGMGVLSTLMFGSTGAAWRLFVLLLLLLGGVGSWKLVGPDRPLPARVGAMVVYTLSPVALGAMGAGRLQALVAYAAAPWLLRRVARDAGVAPFGDASTRRFSFRQLGGSALLLGLVASLSPLGALLLVATLLVMAAAPALVGDGAGAARMVRAVLLPAAGAAALSAPWLVEWVLRGDLASVTGVWKGSGAMPSAAQIVTGSVGSVQTGWWGWGIAAAALFGLLAGKGWRFAWSAAAWVLAIAVWVLVVLLARGGYLAGAGPELFLVPAALAMAVAVAMSATAFTDDVVGSDFGTNQILAIVAGVALVLSVVPVAVASVDGRWYQPRGDYGRLLRTVDTGETFRSLWIGDPDVLPLAGWQLNNGTGLAVGLSEGLNPLVTQRFRLDGGPGVRQLRTAVDAAFTGGTNRLGQLLAPMGIKYVVVVDRPAPEPFAPREVPVPVGALSALREQLDLVEVPTNPAVALFKNPGAWPLRSDVTKLKLPNNGVPTLKGQLALPPATPPAVLGREQSTNVSGKVPGESQVAQAVSGDPAWSLTVDGREAERSDLFGWGQSFTVKGQGGTATLKWSTPQFSRLLQLGQVLVLLALLAMTFGGSRLVPRSRRNGAGSDEGPVVVVEEPADMAPLGDGTGSGLPGGVA